ncbi:MAG TPA: YdiU family protein [Sulfurivirga caldicuralii]|nr:YdiU family protein [Sulfurivirga caldicuralii]
MNWPFEYTYTQLPDTLWARVDPIPVRAPRLLIFNDALADTLGLSPWLEDVDLAALFSGNWLPPGARPFAQAYAGHQFGHFALLGDGRALILGEWCTADGQHMDLQFKGSGRTPFSRRGDGRAAVGPMLREYLISEAMYALGIPTTRALAVVATGETVLRTRALPGAVLTRVASSHIRVGTFELAARINQTTLQALADYTIQRHFPACAHAKRPYLALLEAVIAHQARLISQWLHVGFIHGVMNTDNMSIAGETIDYGPCAFMDTYHPDTVFSSIDTAGRYAFANQPTMGIWNLTRFAETLLPLLDERPDRAKALAQDALADFGRQLQQHWLEGMAAKLALSKPDSTLIYDLLQHMADTQQDYTLTFRYLAQWLRQQTTPLPQTASWQAWLQRWRNGLTVPPYQAADLMDTVNPCIIPRNHQVQKALDAAEAGDMAPFNALLNALRQPFCDNAATRPFMAAPREDERIMQTFCGT